MTGVDENSKRTRVQPVFRWLREHGEGSWPARLVALAHGMRASVKPGKVLRMELERERRVPPSARRLAWLIRNVESLAPREGRQWRAYGRRVVDNDGRDSALERLDQGETRGIDRLLRLEGATACDCLIECENAVIWIEGKRNDWLDYSTTWDVTRDQLARNTEAAWLVGTDLGKDFCVLLCHELPLKHHEQLLVDGYRAGTWFGGWPHLTTDERAILGARIGSVTWGEIVDEWPALAAQLAP